MTMNIVQVRSLPFKDVLRDLAKAFGTTCTENCGEYTLLIPSAWGTGLIRGVNFEGGIGIIEYNCTFKEDLELRFIVSKIHPLKYLFCLEGKLKHRFDNETLPHLLEQYQNVIVASKEQTGHVLNFNKGVYTDVYSVEIDRKLFKSKMECEIEHSKPKLQAIFEDDTALNSFYYKGLYSLILSLLFQEIKEFHHNGLIRKIFLEGKAYQIMAYELIQYDDDDVNESHQYLIRKSEVKSILEAINIIEHEIESLDSIQSIAHRVGLNGNKIQNGFQALYGLTVNEYIQRSRLELAKKLLLNTDFSIQEIMSKVGWTSKSYFSKIFKEKYNYSPSSFRKKNSKIVLT